METMLVIVVVFAFLALTLIAKGFRVVQQGDSIIIERLGSYFRTLASGLNVIVPFVDQPRAIFWVINGQVFSSNRIDMRETVLDVPSQVVITRDNVSIEIDALLYIQIADPVKAAYEIANLPQAVAQLSQTSLRNVIGEMDLGHTLTSHDTINAKLKTVLDEATDKWGTKANRVELKNITLPREIQIAMEEQMQAERERRAKVLEAEAIRAVAEAKKDAVAQINSAFSEPIRSSPRSSSSQRTTWPSSASSCRSPAIRSSCRTRLRPRSAPWAPSRGCSRATSMCRTRPSRQAPLTRAGR